MMCTAIYHPPFAKNLFEAARCAPSLPLRPLAELDHALPDAMFIVVQGSYQLFQSLALYTSSPLPLLYLPTLTLRISTLPPPWSVLDIPHRLCGGLLSGPCPIIHNADQWTPVFTTVGLSYPRALRHVINQAAKGFHPEALAPHPGSPDILLRREWYIDRISKVLDWNGLLSPSFPFAVIRCPSVYTSSKWTHRALNPDELAAVYDLPTWAIKFFATWPFGQRRQLPFLRSIPSRVLTRLWHALRPLSSGGVPPSVVANADTPGEDFKCLTNKALPLETSTKLGDTSKATKADDAPVPIFLWDDRIWRQGSHCEAWLRQYVVRFAKCPLTAIRICLLRRWRRNITTSFLCYLRKQHGKQWMTCHSPELAKDVDAGIDCITRATRCTWWEWSVGSRIFFWRWPERWQADMRDGFQTWMSGTPPSYFRPQRGDPDPKVREQMTEKLTDVRLKGYIAKGLVKSLTSYFAVPKGLTDIRMVYDATKSLLNAALFAPSFGLPTADAATRAMNNSTWMADVDLGEMFLNFILHASLQQYCGVDLKPYFLDELGPKAKTLWEVWTRCMMGLKNSPYGCVKGILIAFEMVRGDFRDESHPYHYSKIELNLPGSENYDPSKPWVCKIRNDGQLANDTVVYVDDLRSMGGSEEECWRVVHTTGCMLSYLGLQVAFRKTRPPSQTQAGAWAGTVFGSGEEGVSMSVTQEKWDKGKAHLEKLQSGVANGLFNFKELESIRGFFIHLCRTYDTLTPFVKGMHLTLDSWRPGRNAEGWKVKSVDEVVLDAAGEGIHPLPEGHPRSVTPVPRLKADVEALLSLMSANAPPKRAVRPKRISVVVYGFGDASGAGFGSTFSAGKDVYFRHGVWGKDAEGLSSNYRELRNLVEALEDGVKAQQFQDSEIFLFTDNTTAEGAYWKGNTPSPVLFELVVRLHKLEMAGELRLHVIHVAGTRMIKQGTDALSRGCLSEGVMSGKAMIDFVPLNETALERSSTVLHWVRDWVEDPTLQALKPGGWFFEGHGLNGGKKTDIGIWIPEEAGRDWFLWVPPPAAADVAIEELTSSRHKRTEINHVFICPRLMTQRWRKKINKLADVVFEIPAGSTPFWPKEMHEPLLVAILLRFVSVSPWQLRRHSRVLELGRELSLVWKAQTGCGRSVLRELCLLPGLLERM